ncbi:MAG: glycerophosphodiester phosphodiesterase [Gammaproteobacteria bacterium]|jgi:glycerophosphoryl diester phosphodiesterase
MLIIGHRGAAGTHPENTLASIDAAIAARADWIEIDVRLVDGEIIVLHDERLERTTNGSGSVYDMTFEQLRRLDAGDGEHIPLLREVLERIDARCGLNIEIKQPDIARELATFLRQVLRARPAWHGKIMVSSFLREPMLEFAALKADGVELAALSDHTSVAALEFALAIGATALNVSLAELTGSIVAMAHERDLRLLVYTVNDAVDMARCRELDVDGIFTDYPLRAIAFLRDEPMI